jgi:DNA-binding response OmpR family regulator
VHISHLRRKLADMVSQLIRTVYGVGYAFYPEEDE